MQRYSCQYPVCATNGSNQHLGHCRVAFRSSASFAAAAATFQKWPQGRETSPLRVASPSPGPCADVDAAYARADVNALAMKVSGDPAKWPADRTQHILVSIQSVQLHGAWADSHRTAWGSLTIFWNLLDSLVDAQMESTRRVPHTGLVLSFGDTALYNLAGTNLAQQDARVRS
jgi:hypothetical protein